MPITILLPALSPTMEQGNLVKWLKKEGEKVVSGDVIAEVETDKATMEIECFDDGTLAKILVNAGSKKVAINTPIAIILLEGEDNSLLNNFNIEGEKKEQKSEVKQTDAQLPVAKNAISAPITEEHMAIQTYVAEERIKASPLAKRIANDSNIDLSKIIGSGPSGRIIKNDVLEATKTPNKANNTQCSFTNKKDSKIEISTMRAMIAERLLYSKQSIPHYYLSSDCNLDKLLALRKEINEQLSEKITINDFIVKAVALSLKKHPDVNCSWNDTHILQYGNVDVAVAVAIKGGLITPILKNADEKNITQISKEVKELAEKAKSGTLSKEEYQGGSITISNLGMYDIKEFIAIINPPQSSILAIGKGEKRAVVIEDKLAISTVMTVTLSSDHRVVDGATGAEFLRTFKRYMEFPVSMLVF